MVNKQTNKQKHQESVYSKLSESGHHYKADKVGNPGRSRELTALGRFQQEESIRNGARSRWKNHVRFREVLTKGKCMDQRMVEIEKF